MRINTNINALNTLRNLSMSEKSVADSTAKLSSGFRINKASDDAAGLAIANKLRNTGAALTQASRNADQASSMLQIADGAAQTLGGIIDRMKQLAAAAASASAGSGADDQRPKLQAEFTALNSEITRIVATTKYQGVGLLSGGGTPATHTLDTSAVTDAGDISDISIQANVQDGSYTISSDGTSNGVVTVSDGTHTQKLIAVDGAQTLNFDQIGITIKTGVGFKASTTSTAASFDTQAFTVAAGSAATTGMDFLIGASGDATGNDLLTVNLGSGITALSNDDISSSQGAAEARMADVDTLLDNVNTFVGSLGAAESRINFAQQNLASTMQNTAAAESTIRDVDMASEMANFTKAQILQSAGTAMLAQANQNGQSVLRLFQ
jgi:flagellin